jgi:fibro-slime domain-containing protein
MWFAARPFRSPHSIFLSTIIALSSAACSDSGGGGVDERDRDGGHVGGDSDGQVIDPDDAGYDWYVLDGGSDGATNDAAPIPVGCGDGERDKAFEDCDDGANKSGDGCSADCKLESGYACDPNGGECMAICGDGAVVGKEACDDKNSTPGDGCSATCALESGWACPTAGMACEPARCGDRIQVGTEQCDHGDANNGDGCSATCQVESGWTCGVDACAAASCGDGIVAGDEVCDDSNAATPGCSADCSAVEAEYVCPVLGGACTKYTACGNGVFTANEGCDDGDTDSGDGCSATCTVEPGYACAGGTRCGPRCGDGTLLGAEVCDDRNAASGDGCSASCQLEQGWKCPTLGQACTRTTCGDGIVEGLEQCDDGLNPVKKNALGDGCTPDCKSEPNCSNGTCTAVCGDGIVATTETCDDGNNRDGDGCRANCSGTEAGFACTDITTAPPNCIDLPLVLRDFKSFNNGTPGRHPDFNNDNGEESGIVRDTLGWDVDNNGNADGSAPGAPNVGMPRSVVYAKQGVADDDTTTHGAANFNQWYHDSSAGKTVLSTMRVCDADTSGVRDGQYVFDNANFFPLDGKGWQDSSVPSGDREQNGSGSHNFGFTSEVRFWFTYKGTERLQFRGDDDVWVFINNKLAVDLGGVHGAQTATITFNAGGDAVCTGRCQSATRDLNLVVGNVYEVVVFQAERHESASSYKLTLGDFFSKRTQCVPSCGDGVRVSGEICDEGGVCNGGTNAGQACNALASGACQGGGGTCTNLNTGAYGECATDCLSRGPYCGDGVKQTEEICDLGPGNNGSYNGCNPNCTSAPRCGDMRLDRAFGEQCDQGAANANGVYNVCSTSCTLGPRCGDNVLQADQGEQCDDGVNKATYGTGGCAPGCKLASTCGDGVVQSSQGEQCDNGTGNNTGAYGGCNMNCSRAAYCGDKVKNAENGEECDDGNANNFDGCSAQCKVEVVLL